MATAPLAAYAALVYTGRAIGFQARVSVCGDSPKARLRHETAMGEGVKGFTKRFEAAPC